MSELRGGSPLIAARRKRALAALAALPEVIKVGAHDVAILIRDKFLTTHDLLGQYDSNAQVVSLSDQLETSTHVVETFIHEVNHAIYRSAALEDSDGEERIVLTMSLGQVALVKDTPWYRGWVSKYA